MNHTKIFICVVTLSAIISCSHSNQRNRLAKKSMDAAAMRLPASDYPQDSDLAKSVNVVERVTGARLQNKDMWVAGGLVGLAALRAIGAAIWLSPSTQTITLSARIRDEMFTNPEFKDQIIRTLRSIKNNFDGPVKLVHLFPSREALEKLGFKADFLDILDSEFPGHRAVFPNNHDEWVEAMKAKDFAKATELYDGFREQYLYRSIVRARGRPITYFIGKIDDTGVTTELKLMTKAGASLAFVENFGDEVGSSKELRRKRFFEKFNAKLKAPAKWMTIVASSWAIIRGVEYLSGHDGYITNLMVLGLDNFKPVRTSQPSTASPSSNESTGLDEWDSIR